MSDSEYRGPGELTSALGEGTKGVVVGSAVGMGAGALLSQSQSINSVLNANTGVGKHLSGAVNHLANTGIGRNVGETVSSFTRNMPGIKITNMPAVGTTGRAALVTGAVVATATGLWGLASGWGRASQARKSWVETVEGRSGGQISR